MMDTMATAEPRVRRTPWPPLLHRLVKTVRTRELLAPGQHLLVAVSGGPDSVALLTLLHRLIPRWHLRLTAVHFNYGLRGNESEEDQSFVMSLCDSLRVPLHCVPLNVRTRPQRVSLQAQARELRYCTMTRLAQDIGADRIAVGHTADDQAETILLWMMRGAGLSGLAGMPVQRDGMVIRPLYDVRRREVLAFLDSTRQAYRQDSSNAKPVYARNRIRQELVPVLTRLAPAAIDALCRMGDLCREDDRYLDAQAAKLGAWLIRLKDDGRYSIDRHRLQAEPPAMQRRIVREVFRRLHPVRQVPAEATVETVRKFLSSKAGGERLCAGGVRVWLTQGDISVQSVRLVARQPERDLMVEIPSVQIPSVIEWAGTGQRIQVQEGSLAEAYQLSASRGWAMMVDADRLTQPLRIRSWRAGDRFVPFGMNGRSKKLQDYFVDLKIPLSQRRRIPILEASEGIVGVLGFRQDERFRVSGTTRRCLIVSIDEVSASEGVD